LVSVRLKTRVLDASWVALALSALLQAPLAHSRCPAGRSQPDVEPFKTGNARIQRIGCLTSVLPDPVPASGRSWQFIFGADNLMEVAVFPAPPGRARTWSNTSANESFFVFPRRQLPTYQLLKDGTLRVRLTSGDAVSIDPRSADKPLHLSSVPGSGVEVVPGSGTSAYALKPSPGSSVLVLDVGRCQGNVAQVYRTRSSRFEDGQGRSCEVPNSELFVYTAATRYDPPLAFKTDAALADFLAKRCPQLDLTGLQHLRATGRPEEEASTVAAPAL
jgi:hypothetical protein